MELNLMSTSIMQLAFVRDGLDGAGGVTVCDGEVTPAGGASAAQIRRILALGPEAFGTPYEATAWSILSARGPGARADALWRALVAEHGEAVDLGDAEPRRAFPLPRAILGLTDLPGVPAEKLWRLHDVAEAALNGLLDATALAALPEDEALARLKSLRGIGDFYAELILDRAVRASRDD
jgi:DNA-3-methyladenine glycosylase II